MTYRGWTIARWIGEASALAGIWILIFLAWLVADACLVVAV